MSVNECRRWLFPSSPLVESVPTTRLGIEPLQVFFKPPRVNAFHRHDSPPFPSARRARYLQKRQRQWPSSLGTGMQSDPQTSLVRDDKPAGRSKPGDDAGASAGGVASLPVAMAPDRSADARPISVDGVWIEVLGAARLAATPSQGQRGLPGNMASVASGHTGAVGSASLNRLEKRRDRGSAGEDSSG